MLAAWDATYARDSAAAAIYATWRGRLDAAGARRVAAARRATAAARGEPRAAIDQLTTSQGADWSGWRWGRMHTRAVPAPAVAGVQSPDRRTSGRHRHRRRRRRQLSRDPRRRRLGSIDRHERAGPVGAAGEPVLQQPAPAVGRRCLFPARVFDGSGGEGDDASDDTEEVGAELQIPSQKQHMKVMKGLKIMKKNI